MQRQLDIVIDFSKQSIQMLRSGLMEFSAERPAAALAMVIIFSMILLPLITAAVLTPFSMFLDLSHFLASKGLLYVLYTLVFQVIALAGLILVLFCVAFFVAGSLTMLHSYNSFSK
ncbi:hypothetical protein JTB14_031842 [Gonioctena quinquepunctata]|nr:hypothetical protein JTB14_031842 [Gonioctena quinquepunctata]